MISNNDHIDYTKKFKKDKMHDGNYYFHNVYIY